MTALDPSITGPTISSSPSSSLSPSTSTTSSRTPPTVIVAACATRSEEIVRSHAGFVAPEPWSLVVTVWCTHFAGNTAVRAASVAATSRLSVASLFLFFGLVPFSTPGCF